MAQTALQKIARSIVNVPYPSVVLESRETRVHAFIIARTQNQFVNYKTMADINKQNCTYYIIVLFFVSRDPTQLVVKLFVLRVLPGRLVHTQIPTKL